MLNARRHRSCLRLHPPVETVRTVVCATPEGIGAVCGCPDPGDDQPGRDVRNARRHRNWLRKWSNYGSLDSNPCAMPEGIGAVYGSPRLTCRCTCWCAQRPKTLELSAGYQDLHRHGVHGVRNARRHRSCLRRPPRNPGHAACFAGAFSMIGRVACSRALVSGRF